MFSNHNLSRLFDNIKKNYPKLETFGISEKIILLSTNLK